MTKHKIIWNPLNPDITPEKYAIQVGNNIEKLINIPGYLKSSFNSIIDDQDQLNMLNNVHLKRRTSEKPRWQGASGYKHQIDDSFSTDDEKIILLIEYKHWQKSVTYPAFSAFLIRLLDIAANNKNSLILGTIYTPQGHQGRAGGSEENKQCIESIKNAFNKKVINKLNCYTRVQIFTDQLILETQSISS